MTDPLIFGQPIVNEDGTPTDYFLRQWGVQRLGDLTLEQEVEAIKAINLIAGVALAGGGDLSGPDRTFDLENTAVTPSTYGDATNVPQITIDQQGRITDAANVPINLGAQPYDIGAFFPGVYTDSQLLLQFVFDRTVDFDDDFAGSTGIVGVDPTIAATMDLQKNDISIGTVSITTGGVVTFVTSGGTTQFVSGDWLSVIAQGTADATLADASLSFKGLR